MAWADDNNNFSFDINRFARQLAGNSVLKSTNISLASSWPITDHSVTDVASDTFNGSGQANGSCPGMDILGTREQQWLTVVQRNGSAFTQREVEPVVFVPLVGEHGFRE